MEPRDGVSSSHSEIGHGDAVKGSGDFVAAKVARESHRILLIDDSLMRRQCLEYVLCSRIHDCVVESIARVGEASGQNPDLVLLDIGSAARRNGGLLEQVAEIQAKFSARPILAISDVDDMELAITAIRCGLRGYVPASVAIDTVIAAIRLVLAGGIYVPSELIDLWSGGAAARPEQADPTSDEERSFPICAEERNFTDREAEVLEQLRQGKPNKIIAYELRIAESTVKVHMRNIMRKLNATNRTQVAFLTRAADPKISSLRRPTVAA